MSVVRQFVEDVVELSLLAAFVSGIACLARAWMGG
jgi:hypothetical protein